MRHDSSPENISSTFHQQKQPAAQEAVQQQLLVKVFVRRQQWNRDEHVCFTNLRFWVSTLAQTCCYCLTPVPGRSHFLAKLAATCPRSFTTLMRRNTLHIGWLWFYCFLQRAKPTPFYIQDFSILHFDTACYASYHSNARPGLWDQHLKRMVEVSFCHPERQNSDSSVERSNVAHLEASGFPSLLGSSPLHFITIQPHSLHVYKKKVEKFILIDQLKPYDSSSVQKLACQCY